MSYLVERKIEVHFRTAATLVESGKARVIVVESRPNYAVVKLVGARKGYPISWEQIFRIAEKNYAESLRLEEDSAKRLAQELKERDRPKVNIGCRPPTPKSKNRADAPGGPVRARKGNLESR